MLSFSISREDEAIVRKIAERAVKQNLFNGRKQVEYQMDLSACHANGTPLDFKRLLEFDDFNFLHDVCGIASNLDHNTGKLMNCFCPRSARAVPVL